MCQSKNKSVTKLRHRWEMPMIWFSTIITIIGFIVGCIFLGIEEKDYISLGLDNEIVEELSLLVFIPLIPIFYYIYRFYIIAKTTANAILINEQQFPELFLLYKNIAKRLEMDQVPKLYLINGNGTVNAFALECNKRFNYVVIYAEIALLHSTAPDIVEFILAHELAHHKLRHVALWRTFIGIIPNFLVIPGIATTRAQEYSADRVAFSVCPSLNAMNLLTVGPWMYDGVNHEAWLEQSKNEKDEIFIRLVNIMSDHAVMIKRFKALKDLERDGYSAHGEMF